MVTYLQKSGRLSAEDRRRQLIEVAIGLFSLKGFGGTTTKEIATAAGVNEAIIFRHFATKQHLYEAILDQKIRGGVEGSFAEVSALMALRDDEAVFGWLVGIILKLFREDARFERLMLFAALEGHEIAVMHYTIVNPFVDALKKYISERQQAGALVKCDPHLIICGVAGVAKQYASGKYLFNWKPIAEADSEVAKTLTAILMSGIRVKGKKRERRTK